ncbi:MAG: TIR domain-containing protein [Pseudomonadota bacterium]
MSEPLVVRVAFHPHSENARTLARAIDAALNGLGTDGEVLVPGLNIPTWFFPEDSSGLPPVTDPGRGDQTVTIVLADDLFAAPQPPLPFGRATWAAWTADLILAAAKDATHRVFPFQLSPKAWPLDERLTGHNFARAHLAPDQVTWVIQRVFVELSRYLAGLPWGGEGARAQVKVFVSHAKLDIHAKLAPARAVMDTLTAEEPVASWVDGAEIAAGTQYATAISAGIQESSVLAVLTDAYSRRDACQREVVLAKRHGLPLLFLDARERSDPRAFPYLGNAQWRRWTAKNQAEARAQARRAIDLLVRETVRHQHAVRVLEPHRQLGERALPTTPELAQVAGQGRTFLYPDPPLGDVELTLLSDAGCTVVTPLTRAAREERSLVHQVVGLSMSESPDAELRGMTNRAFEHAQAEISRHLLARGATLAYGGHLGAKGYTLRLFELVRAHHGQATLPPIERIRNYYGWPLTRAPEVTAGHAAEADIRILPRPPHPALAPFAEEGGFGATNGSYRFAWATGMTAMRATMTEECAARIVLGGKTGQAGPGVGNPWYLSRIPGVMEEVLLSLRARKPVFVVGCFGGAATCAADLLRGRDRPDFTWEFQQGAPHAPAMRAICEQEGTWEDYDSMVATFRRAGVSGLNNGLDEDENLELFETRDLDRIITLLVKGLLTL